jgi:hypothetical protein
MDSRFCSCGVDTHACGQGHCRTHHRDYPVLNGGEGCPDCALDRNPLVNKLDELAKQFKAAEDTEINRLTAELSQLRTAHDAAVEEAKKLVREAESTLAFYAEKGRVVVSRDGNAVQRMGASAEIAILKAEAEIDRHADKIADLSEKCYTLTQERDSALATGREAGLREAAEILRKRKGDLHVPAWNNACHRGADAILAAIPSPSVVLDGFVQGLVNGAVLPVAAIPSPPKGCEWQVERHAWGKIDYDCGCENVLQGIWDGAELKFCPFCGLPISIKAEEGKP